MAIRGSIMVIFVIVFLSSLLAVTRARPRAFHRLPLGRDMIGPETVAFDCKGRGPYVGVSDGRILKWQGRKGGWTEFATTSPNRPRACDGLHDSPKELYCGRPLGLKFDKSTCELYITDSSLGFMKVGPHGGIATSLASGINGVPFRFLNALDIDSKTGEVYFTDTSTEYHRWNYLAAISSFDRSGRLMKYDPSTKAITILLSDLAFANGVALSKNRDFVLVAETTRYQIRRLWLTGPKAGASDIFANLTGLPDNINRNSKGEFWVAQYPTKPVKLDQFGRIKESLNTSKIVDGSDVSEFHNTIWIGSVVQTYLLYSTRVRGSFDS